ncbi:hypothetical protein SESBI_02352 [Sesbania bispinosa]|nr:hypothetical protein SESBI_02352 [Sesbania bispinosa]
MPPLLGVRLRSAFIRLACLYRYLLINSHSGVLMDNLPLIVYVEEDIREGVNSCLKSLVGRFLTEKPIHANSLPNALAGIWCNPKGFKVEDVGEKTYQFLFAEEKDADRILQGSPWIFRNSWLSLKRWVAKLVPTWVKSVSPTYLKSGREDRHDEDACKSTAAKGSPEERAQTSFGPWLRTSQSGRKVRGTNYGRDQSTQ